MEPQNLNEINNNQHHIWCNYQCGPVKDCKQCQDLFERFPIETNEDLESKYFPDSIKRN